MLCPALHGGMHSRAAAPQAWKDVLCRQGDKLVGLTTLKSGEGKAITDRR